MLEDRTHTVNSRNERHRLPSRNRKESLIHAFRPPIHVPVRQYHLGVWICLQQFINKQDSWDILDDVLVTKKLFKVDFRERTTFIQIFCPQCFFPVRQMSIPTTPDGNGHVVGVVTEFF